MSKHTPSKLALCGNHDCLKISLKANYASSHFTFVLSGSRLPFCLFTETNQIQRINCWTLIAIHIRSFGFIVSHFITEQRYQFKRNIVLSLIGCKEKSYFRRQISIKSFGNACSFSFSMSPSVVASFACFLSDIPLTLIMTFKSPSTSQRNSFQMMLLTMQLLPHRHFHFIMTTFFFLILVSCVFENNKELSCKLLGVSKRYNLQ